MKLSKLQRAAVGRAYRAAKPYLAHRQGENSHKSNFICVAIGDAFAAGKCGSRATDYAHDIINNRLGEYNTLAGWLRSQEDLGLIQKGSVKRDLNCGGVKIQATRHAWLDSLIAEFS